MVEEISADELAARLDRREPPAIVDTRDRASYEAWRVPGALHFPFSTRDELDGRLADLRELVGEDVDEIVTICALGVSSAELGRQLQDATDEYRVLNVAEGMRGWSRVYDLARVDVGSAGRSGESRAAGPRDVVVEQVQRRATGCLGYVIGDPAAGEALVVDPSRDLEVFRSVATDANLDVVGVLDTHVHADHLSGGRRLADALDVPYYLGDRAAPDRGATVEHAPLADGDTVAVGSLEVTARHTPGHTSEMIAPVIEDVAVCTADSLHVNATGRTELEHEDGETGARMLYRSLQDSLLRLPDSVMVLPGHVGVAPDGTFSHGTPGEPIATTIGTAREEIPALSMDEDAFVAHQAGAGAKPANYRTIIDVNRGVRTAEGEERLDLEMGPNNCAA